MTVAQERSAMLFEAEEAERRGEDARERWARVAQAETNLLFTVDEERHRTRGILGVSAASLWQRAGRKDQVICLPEQTTRTSASRARSGR